MPKAMAYVNWMDKQFLLLNYMTRCATYVNWMDKQFLLLNYMTRGATYVTHVWCYYVHYTWFTHVIHMYKAPDMY